VSITQSGLIARPLNPAADAVAKMKTVGDE
jgi:hypothetical protein